MSTAPTPTPSKQGKGKKEKKLSLTQQNERLKIVVRRLPPNLPEDIFWQSVLPWVTEESTTWKVFYPGKLRKKLNKENIHARAYIAFKNEEQLALFGHRYDGHVFRDKNGLESQAVVEFAPHPKVPSDKKKADGRSGTIEKDEDYISFIESLKAAENAEPVSIEALIASSQPPPPPKTTPLLEALKAEKSAAKDKEAILRNHAHYKQGDAAVRKEDKKKATSSVATTKDAQPPNLPPTASKKSKKDQSQVPDLQSPRIAVNSSTPRNVPRPIPKQIAQSSSTRPPKPPKLRQVPPNRAPSTSASNMTSDPIASASANNQPVPASQAEPPRRARPVIASRQFEAALSVAGLATSASERRKRDKEKVNDATSSSTVDDNSATSPAVSKRELQVTTSDNRSAQASRVAGSSLGLDTEKAKSNAQSPLPSPKKDRLKRGGRFDGPGRSGTQSSAVANPTAIKIPSILQRSDTATGSTAVVVPRQMSSNTDFSVVESSTKSDMNLPGGNASPPRGRVRRGRGVGRGTGRGGGRGGQATTAPRESG